MTPAANPYCAALGIETPSLAAVKDKPDANYYSLLIVALLERGAPLTLREAAARFEEAGVAPADRALAALKRCKPSFPILLSTKLASMVATLASRSRFG